MKKDYRALWLLLIIAGIMTYIVIVCQSPKPDFKGSKFIIDTTRVRFPVKEEMP